MKTIIFFFVALHLTNCKDGIPTDNSLLGIVNEIIIASRKTRTSTSTGTSTVVSISTSITASFVYGQGGSFTSNAVNNGGITGNSLSSPTGVALDSSGNMYISDGGNHRVLFFTSGSSTTASGVYGQAGSYISATSNNGGISANSLSTPKGIALDSSGNLYICDYGNHRVLYYTSGSTTASRVYGQGGNFTSNTQNNGGITANSLYNPFGVAVDSSGNLYICDYGNNRVLYYTSGSTTASRVYGQNGFYTSNASNNGGISANSLDSPSGVAVDSSGNLYIVDQNNNRVLYYTSGSTTATRVYGQNGFYTSNSSNNGGISANSLYNPYGVAVDSSGNLFIGDTYNHRVLYYTTGSTVASRVYGQGGNFTSNTLNNGGVSTNSLYYPFGIAISSATASVYIADQFNQRVLRY